MKTRFQQLGTLATLLFLAVTTVAACVGVRPSASLSPLAGGTIAPTAPAAAPTTLEAIVMAASQAEVKSYPSPDGQWRAEVAMFPCTPVGADEELYAYETLTLVRIAGSEKTGVDHQLINCGGLGAYGLEGIGWSADSRHFDYTDAREGTPDGDASSWQRPVLRLSVESRDVMPAAQDD